MDTMVKIRLIELEDAYAICIPQAFLDQANIVDAVEVELQNGYIVLRAARHARDGWEAQFHVMAQQGGNLLLDANLTTVWDEDEWEW